LSAWHFPINSWILSGVVSKKESDIRIINEPLETPSKVPSVFMVETGEALSRPETTLHQLYSLAGFEDRIKTVCTI
jgi:hypothetical protein